MIWTSCYKELVGTIRGKNELLTPISDEYSELREQIGNTSEIEYTDMWHGRISFLDEEHPFPSPAAFTEFNTLGTEDGGLLVQRLHTQIDFRLSYETFSDTCEGAAMQEEALSFLGLLTLLGIILHGKSGENFGTLRRTHAGREEPGGTGNLYRISFEREIMDYIIMKLVSHVDMKDREVKISNGGLPEKAEDGEPLYHLWCNAQKLRLSWLILSFFKSGSLPSFNCSQYDKFSDI